MEIFENKHFENFCNEQGFSHNFSSPKTLQKKKGVVERKTLQEMTRTMLIDNDLPKYFRPEAINVACYILNRCLIKPILEKTPYELWKGRKPNVSYFHDFGCKCFIHNNDNKNLGKFDDRSDEGLFLGYSTTCKSYMIYNKRTIVIEESMHVAFDDANPFLRKCISLGNDEGDPNKTQEQEM